MTFDPEEFKRERDEAIRSLDETKIRAYAEKYGASLSGDPTVFWAAIHMARMTLFTATGQEQTESRRWLAERGFKIRDDDGGDR